MRHLNSFDEDLYMRFRELPIDHIKCFESAIETIYRNDIFDASNPDLEEAPRFQVQFSSDENPITLRDLNSNLIGKIVAVPGIITATSKSSIRARKAVFQCVKCGVNKVIDVPYGLSKLSAPGLCDNPAAKCGIGTYRFDPDRSEYVDQQTMKLQEAPEQIPTGEMPRNLMLTVDRFWTDKCSPGNRVKVVGILTVMKMQRSNADSNANKHVRNTVQKSYIRVIGIQSGVEDNAAGSFMGFAMPNITEEDVERFETMKRDPSIYERISRSIAPAIFGHPDIKKAIACLLFGGCPKQLPDGMRLRGDINILLLGDPSVAKSQFLKFVDRVAPISVYTSGKGSSAAGLTASVIKDAATGEF